MTRVVSWSGLCHVLPRHRPDRVICSRQVVGQRSAAAPQLFKHKEFNFEKLGIGGLDAQFEQIFRRAFASRVFAPEIVSRRSLLFRKAASKQQMASCRFWRPMGFIANLLQVERLGIRHVKGVLLYGPPGTGKTLIARQIGKMLNGKEPKIVNGPEVLNKFVGELLHAQLGDQMLLSLDTQLLSLDQMLVSSNILSPFLGRSTLGSSLCRRE